MVIDALHYIDEEQDYFQWKHRKIHRLQDGLETKQATLSHSCRSSLLSLFLLLCHISPRFILKQSLSHSSFTFCQYPFVLSVNTKRTILKRDSEQQMIVSARVSDGYHDRSQTYDVLSAENDDSEISKQTNTEYEYAFSQSLHSTSTFSERFLGRGDEKSR